MEARVLPLSRISLPQALAGAVGIGGISLGVVGLVHERNGHPFFGVTSDQLLGLALNPAHNVQHLLVGAAGLAVMFSLRASRTFGRVLYFFFMLQVLTQMVTFFFPAWNLLGVDEEDILMHALGAVTGLAIAWGPQHRANSAADGDDPKPQPAQRRGVTHVDGDHLADWLLGRPRQLHRDELDPDGRDVGGLAQRRADR